VFVKAASSLPSDFYRPDAEIVNECPQQPKATGRTHYYQRFMPRRELAASSTLK